MGRNNLSAGIIILSLFIFLFSGIYSISEISREEVRFSVISAARRIEADILNLPDAKTEIIPKIVRANNSFGLSLYRQLRSEKGNHFLSPLSLFMALSMTLEGAKGETAEVMARALQLPEEGSVRQSGFKEIQKLINRSGRRAEVRLANAIWIQKDLRVLKNYLDIIAGIYGGQAANVDFLNQAEKTRKMINDWTKERTAGRIKNLIPRGVINELTRVILTNAIYFRGVWLLPFDPQMTRPEKFYLNDGREIQVPTMRLHGEQARFPYMENEDLQMLEMLYEDQDLSLIILLPKRKDLNSLETKLNVETIEEWERNLKEERVDVYLPRFKIESKYLLEEKLKAMGLDIVFSLKADFSGITGRRDFHIQKVIHQGFIEINEEGTEAAAATGVLIGRTSYIPEKKYVFRADRPFIFIIKEKISGSILFLGRLWEPH